LSRPLIMHHPWTAVIIVGIIFTMVFGMLNLITAVIVDTAAQAREADVMHMAKHKEFERAEAWSNFAELCLILDENHDGEISLEELQKGIREIPELSAHLSVLGVEDDDLEMVFEILDANQDGRITHKEFIRQLYKIQTYELKSAHCFMKHYVEDIRKTVKLLWNKSESQSVSFLRCNSLISGPDVNEVSQPEPEVHPKSPPLDALLPSQDTLSTAPTDTEQQPLEQHSVDSSWNGDRVDLKTFAGNYSNASLVSVSGRNSSGASLVSVSESNSFLNGLSGQCQEDLKQDKKISIGVASPNGDEEDDPHLRKYSSHAPEQQSLRSYNADPGNADPHKSGAVDPDEKSELPGFLNEQNIDIV